jgi:uncharacterized protein with ATP-grasp and redox domains
LRVEAECSACLINRGIAEAIEATTNPALRFRVGIELLRFLSKEFNPTSIPAEIGTKRDRIIKRITGNNDPYNRIKKISNEKALKMMPFARKFVEEGYTQEDRFKRACLCAIVGNIMEFDIIGHRFSFRSLKRILRNAKKDLAIDDTNKIYESLKKNETILYLTDNAGEIIFDTLLVEQLKNMGLEVIVCVKGEPVLNDATLEDAKISKINEIADRVITTGTDTIGLFLKEVSLEFLKFYESADMIFAKGMGYAETITEYKLKKPHVLLFRTKCNPVANYFGVLRGKNVAKLIV